MNEMPSRGSEALTLALVSQEIGLQGLASPTPYAWCQGLQNLTWGSLEASHSM